METIIVQNHTHQDNITASRFLYRRGLFFYLSLLTMSLFMASCTILDDEDEEEDVMSINEIKSFEEQFSISVRQQANTAADVDYLTRIEKEVFYYLNLARLNPQLFAKTFVANYNHNPGTTAGYAFAERKQSLIEDLSKMEPLTALVPDETLFEFAECFATESGKLGYVGHNRLQTGCISPSEGGFAECCAYSKIDNGLWHVLQFLVDAGESNAALGHRRILLDMYQTPHRYMGVANRPHTEWGLVSVLDLWSENNKEKFHSK